MIVSYLSGQEILCFYGTQKLLLCFQKPAIRPYPEIFISSFDTTHTPFLKDPY